MDDISKQDNSTLIKQVLVIRRDLKMRRGKEIAQGAHGSIAFLTHVVQQYFKDLERHEPISAYSEYCESDAGPRLRLTEPQKAWINGIFAKVTLQVPNEQELLAVYEKAKKARLTTHLITDSGRTEFHDQPTNTVVAIGPDYADKIDKVTGDLTLY